MPTPPQGRGIKLCQHKMMLLSVRRSVRLSVYLSVPFYDSVPFARWRHALVAVAVKWAISASKMRRACRFTAVLDNMVRTKKIIDWYESVIRHLV